MINYKLIAYILGTLIALLPLGAQGTEDTSTRVFDPRFRTLQVSLPGAFMAPPVISLDGEEQLCISFDELGGKRSYLRYTLVHCDANWQPSRLLDSDILDGFNEAEVDDYAYSAAVFRPYVNYRICLPNDQMRPLISGNYLLKVYREDETADTPVLQARFSVSEDAVRLTGEATSITDRGTNGEYQQLNFDIDLGQYTVKDPYTELIVTVEQNGIPVPAAQPIRPLRMEPRRLIYEHSPGLIYPAGNEYRRFETVRTDYNGMHIEDSRFETDGYTAILKPDSERATRPYVFDSTQHGRFKIDEWNGSDPDLSADYIWTEFTLDFPRIMNGDVVIDGEFTEALPLAEKRMDWDPDRSLYTKRILLKQGSYNYRYAALPTGRPSSPGSPSTGTSSPRDGYGSEATAEAPRSALDASPIEGNHYETRNEYTIRVYHRPFGSRYDHLIATASIVP